MSYLVAVPEMLASAATDVEGIGSSLSAATAAAAAPTTVVAGMMSLLRIGSSRLIALWAGWSHRGG